MAALISGWAGQISAAALTALGCLALGTALARMIPGRWFVLGVIGTCLADVALLASGIGHSAAILMASATADVHGPVFSQADIGRVSTDYPDLVLAAVLGGFLAGRHRQLLAALLVTATGASLWTAAPTAREFVAGDRADRTSVSSCSRVSRTAERCGPAGLVGHEQATPHLLFALRVELPQPAKLWARMSSGNRSTP